MSNETEGSYDKYTLLHELACNIVSYCTSGRGIFMSRRRVKMQPTRVKVRVRVIINPNTHNRDNACH